MPEAFRDRERRVGPRGRLALAALVAVGAVDLLLAVTSPSLPVVGALDELAHAATAVLLLTNLPMPARPFVGGVLAGSVLIDVDHIPLYTGLDTLTSTTPRPVSHSLATALAIAAVGGVLRGPWRRLALGASLGVSLHLARDLVTGPGVLLLWPLDRDPARLPYGLYAAALLGLAALAVSRTPRRPE